MSLPQCLGHGKRCPYERQSSTRFHKNANSLCYNLPVISRYSRFFVVGVLLLVAGCSGHLPQNNDPKAMAQWKERYGDNDQSSQVLNTMPRDDLDRVVELRAIPKRVLVIGPGATEIVFALGQGAKLAGRDSASDYPSEAAKVSVIGDFNGPNIERAVAANPDFVIVQGETYGRDRIDEWQKQIGAPVASVAATSVKGVAQDIRKIGAWLGASDQAKTVASNIEPGLDASFKSNANGKVKTAIVEVQRSPLMVVGKETLIDDVLNRAGFKNGANVEGYKQLNLESLLANPPDFYIVPSDKLKNASDVKLKLASERNRVLDSLRQTPGLKNLECVRRGRVLIVPADWVLRPGPRLADGIKEMTRQRLQLDAKD